MNRWRDRKKERDETQVRGGGKSDRETERKVRGEKENGHANHGRWNRRVIAEAKRVDGSDKPLYLPAAECICLHVNVGTQYRGLHACFHKQAKPG